MRKKIHTWSLCGLVLLSAACSKEETEGDPEVKPPVVEQPDKPAGQQEAEAVDMGLSVEWSSVNYGATAESPRGKLFTWNPTNPTWGETSQGSVWDDYASGELPKSIAGTKYDIVHTDWGDGWRMPTRDEIEELIFGCERETVERDGRKYYKITGPNGKSIYFTGTHDENYVIGGDDNVIGWAGTVDSKTCPEYFMFGNGAITVGAASIFGWLGAPIRPVRGEGYIYEYKPYAAAKNKWITSIASSKFAYDELGREKSLDYVPGEITVWSGRHQVTYEYLVKHSGITPDILTRAKMRLGYTYYTFVSRKPNLSYDNKIFAIDKEGYLTSGNYYGRPISYTYTDGNLTEVKFGEDGKKFTLRLTYTELDNDASVDLNRYFISTHGIAYEENQACFTNVAAFDAFDFLGKRDRNLVSVMEYIPGKFNQNGDGKTVRRRQTFTYQRDAQGRVTRVTIKKETYGGGGTTSTGDFDIGYGE